VGKLLELYEEVAQELIRGKVQVEYKYVFVSRS
jgi:hypothetical protein